MPKIYEKDKPYPENRLGGSPENRPVGPKRSRYSVGTIVAILIVLALLVWILAFTYGEKEATAMEQFAVSRLVPEVSAVPVNT